MKEDYYKSIIQNSPMGYGYHEILLDDNGVPYDYRFIEVNSSFEEYTGLRETDIVGRTIIEVIPDIVKGEFNWIEYYGEIALNNLKKEFEQYSVALGKTYKVTVFSPAKYFFITLFTDISSEVKSRNIIEESGKAFSNIIEHAPIPIMVHAEGGEVLNISKTWSDISGYSHEEIPTIGSWTEKAYGAKQDELNSFIDELYNLKTRQHDGEFLIKAKDSKNRLWDFYSAYIGLLPDGRKMAMSVALDVTERSNLLAELLSEKQLLEVTLLSVGDGVITTDKVGKITLMNSVAEKLTGWKRHDGMGMNIEEVFKIYNDDNGEKCESIVYKVIDLGVTQELANHTVLYSKDGTKRPIADSAAPIILDSGEIIGVVLVFRDYTEKYQEQEKLRTSEESLKAAQTIAKVGSWELSLNTRVMWASEEAFNIYELDRTSEFIDLSVIQDMVNLKDRENLTKALSDLVQYNKEYNITFTINTPTGKVKYINSRASLKLNQENEPIKVLGVIHDVTEKNTLINTLKYERNIAQMHLDVAGVMIMVLDTNGSVTLINRKGCAVLGLDEKEIIGKNWFDNFLPKEIVEQVKVVFQNVFNKDKEMAINHENTIITASGKERIINWYNTILYDAENNIIGILSSGEDITNLKKRELELEYSAYNDYLTGLHNRRYYEENLNELDIEENYPLTIVMADINGLKLINDAFGHAIGDELLISAANLISENCRDTDLVARIGGDEFVIVMPNTTENSAEQLISKINKKAKTILTQSIPLSISFGYKSKTIESEDIQDIYRSAEDLMYREKLLEIPSMRSSAIETILSTLYEKDKNSELHSRSVSIYSERLAKAYGMDKQDVAEVKTAGLLHDIGKIIISLSIINKKGKLTEEEYSTMKNHPEIGFRILNSTSDMRGISNIVLNHHERIDGMGYPRGIKGEEIPLKSKIIAIADAFDAMTSERTYRDIISNEEALKEIIENAGTQFDPKLAKVFKEHFAEITAK